MDAVGVLRNGGDHHHSSHENIAGSRLSSTTGVEDLGENSNTSSNEEGAMSGKEEGDGDVIMMSSASTAKDHTDRTGRLSCAVSHNLQERQTHNSGSSHHHNPSRANYCQFETPADESRGTFPDDFDEELFINTGQLGEARSDPGQFDEEMDSNSNNNHGLNLDTADHSESSDIEELFAVALKENASRGLDATTPTSSRTGKVTVTRRISASKLSKSRGLAVEVASGSQQHEPSHKDLNNCFDKAGDIIVPVVKKQCLLVDESYNQDDTEDCINESDDIEPHSSFSTSIRKRKCVSEEPHPTKKATTENGTDDKYSFFACDPLESDDDDDNAVLSLAIAPSPSNSFPFDVSPALSDWLSVFSSWSAAERLAAINLIISGCEPAEVRHMMRVIEPQFQRDFISLLPKELALYVLSFLDPKDLLQAAQTCRYWRILCDDSLLWKEKCREAGIGPFSAMAQRVHNKRGKGAPTLVGTLPGSRMCPGASDNNCISSCEPWKAAYLRQHNVEMNWRFQPIRPSKTLKGHDDHVITCLQFSANRIVSGSDDNTLKVWSATTGKCLRTLVGHTGGVWSSQMSGTTIVSGSTDRTLRVWNADTGACLHTLYGHTSTVRCMHLFERKVVSGSRDATLRVWNVDSGECLHVLVGHVAAVRCVQYNGKIVVSGAYDFMVRVWDVESEECLFVLEGHTNRVYSLQFDGIHVVSGSLDTSIRVWDVTTGVIKHTLMGHQSLTSGMELRDNLLVSGNADSTVKIWDINTGRCLLTLTGPNKHLSAVTCLQLINKFVITSSDDGTVKLWDITTGDFVRNLVTLSSGGSGGVVWRIRASETKLVCAVGSRNGTEETKLLVLDFDTDTVKSEEASTSGSSPSKALQCVG